MFRRSGENIRATPRSRSGLGFGVGGWLVAGCVLCLTACRQDMHNQPRYKALAPTNFFEDGRSARPTIEDTVARGQLHLDDARYTGKVNGKDIDYFPIQITRADLARGRERFDIYCAPCHGRLGDGRGMIVLRGLRPPPTYHDPRLVTAPVGHFFDVITNGFGAMFSYASRVPVDDRWRITAYIRALQMSQNAPADLANVSAPGTNGNRMERPPERERMGNETGGGLK